LRVLAFGGTTQEARHRARPSLWNPYISGRRAISFSNGVLTTFELRHFVKPHHRWVLPCHCFQNPLLLTSAFGCAMRVE
jgi:hypothetical protein